MKKCRFAVLTKTLYKLFNELKASLITNK